MCKLHFFNQGYLCKCLISKFTLKKQYSTSILTNCFYEKRTAPHVSATSREYQIIYPFKPSEKTPRKITPHLPQKPQNKKKHIELRKQSELANFSRVRECARRTSPRTVQFELADVTATPLGCCAPGAGPPEQRGLFTYLSGVWAASGGKGSVANSRGKRDFDDKQLRLYVCEIGTVDPRIGGRIDTWKVWRLDIRVAFDGVNAGSLHGDGVYGQSLATFFSGRNRTKCRTKNVQKMFKNLQRIKPGNNSLISIKIICFCLIIL